MIKSLLVFFLFCYQVSHAQPLEINDPELNSSEFSSVDGNYHSPIHDWCRNKLGALNYAYNQAMMSYQDGHYDKAIYILHQGLVNASYNMAMPFQRTLTSKTINRGIQISQSLQKSFGRNDLEKKSIAHFLSEYYKLIEKVATTIDIPYYLPQDCHSRCHQNSLKELERAVLELVRSSTSMVMYNLTTPSEGVIYPLSHPRIFLSVLEVTLRYAVYDLSQGLYGYRFACTVIELQNTALRLKSYLSFRAVYNNDFHAVQSSYQEAQHAIDSMNCH